MSRVMGLACVLLVAFGGCVSSQRYNDEMIKAKNQIAIAQKAAAAAQQELRDNEAQKLKADANLKELTAKSEELAAKLAQAQKDAEALQSSVGEIRDVPGIAIDKSGKVQLMVPFEKLADLSIDTQKSVASAAKVIARGSGPVIVDGYTDNIPMAAPDSVAKFGDNLGLSLARSAAVARILIDNGVAADRLIVRGFGSNFPLVGEDGAKNRRVEVYYAPVVEKAAPKAEPAAAPAPKSTEPGRTAAPVNP